VCRTAEERKQETPSLLQKNLVLRIEKKDEHVIFQIGNVQDFCPDKIPQKRKKGVPGCKMSL